MRHFLHSSLVNLPLLASLEERSTHRVLDCFLGAGNEDDLKKEFLVDETTRDVLALFWEAVAVRNRPATELVMLKVCNVKLSFDIWLVLYIYFILYS